MDTHRYTDTHTDADKNPHIYTHTDTYTERHTNTQTHTDTLMCAQSRFLKAERGGFLRL